MMISSEAFAVLVTVATIVTAVAPLVLIVLWIKDWLKKQLW